MSLIHRTLTLGNWAFSALAFLLSLIALWAWVQALVLGSGGPSQSANAFVWSCFAVMVWGVVVAIEWAQNQGA